MDNDSKFIRLANILIRSADTFYSSLINSELSYDFEELAGWTVGEEDDDATAGIWELNIPNATFFNENQAQPGSDYSEDG